MTLDEERVSDLIRAFGQMLEETGEIGFILTYHISPDSPTGVMDIAGTGIPPRDLGMLLAEAFDHAAERGSTL